ncbi:MAG: YdcF family protein [Deltaproteobacteria bacterium]|nr:YdcF family protein [Deltaproteobacteria bacterium]
MEYLYIIFKGFIDPVFIVFILLIMAFFICIFESKKKNGALILFLSIVLLYGASIFPVANYLCYYLEKDYIINPSGGDKNINVIVVLGNGSRDINFLKNTFNTEIGSARLLHAVSVYNKTGAKYFVCMGKGNGKITEAEVMASLAEKLGVPKEKIRTGANSKNTWGNAVELNKILNNKNINIGLVTSAYHMKRSERELKKYFNNVLPLPANYLYSSPTGNAVLQYLPQTQELYKTSIAFKEIVGQLWYRLK